MTATSPPRRRPRMSNRRLSFGSRQREYGQIYLDPRDWWIGAYVAPAAVYVCLLPCIVVKIHRWVQP